jgi:hypothetical protein
MVLLLCHKTWSKELYIKFNCQWENIMHRHTAVPPFAPTFLPHTDALSEKEKFEPTKSVFHHPSSEVSVRLYVLI